MCHQNVENESHFLFHCKEYDSVRNSSKLFSLPLALGEDAGAILESDDEETIQLLANYIAKANNIRAKKLASEM